MSNNNLWDGFLGADTKPDTALPSFEGSRVLLSGGGGYIGSAVARALLSAGVERLTLLDNAEHGLARVGDESTLEQGSRLHLVLGNVEDSMLLREVFKRDQPHLVIHAAARKHVPLLEGNALAAAATNVLGTATLLQESLGASQFLLLSTDKAVKPISVMGATKRMAEQMVLATRSVSMPEAQVVRLCNVLGSTGSVAPGFAKQIERGEPLTITDPHATRFYISLAQTVEFVLHAAACSLKTGLAIPRVDRPHSTMSLARWMLQAANRSVQDGFVYTGLRAGERLHEQLAAPEECVEQNTSFPLLNVQVPAVDKAGLREAVVLLRKAVANRDRAALSEALRPFIVQPEMDPVYA